MNLSNKTLSLLLVLSLTSSQVLPGPGCCGGSAVGTNVNGLPTVGAHGSAGHAHSSDPYLQWLMNSRSGFIFSCIVLAPALRIWSDTVKDYWTSYGKKEKPQMRGFAPKHEHCASCKH